MNIQYSNPIAVNAQHSSRATSLVKPLFFGPSINMYVINHIQALCCVADKDNEFLIKIYGCCSSGVYLNGGFHGIQSSFPEEEIEPYFESWNKHCWTWNADPGFLKVKSTLVRESKLSWFASPLTEWKQCVHQTKYVHNVICLYNL